MSRDAPFTSLSAYQGARVAAHESTLTADTLAALGAQIAPSTGGQFDLSGDDAVENHPAAMWGNQFQSTWRHLTANVNLWPRPLVLMANPERVQLPGAQPAGRAHRRRPRHSSTTRCGSRPTATPRRWPSSARPE